MSGQKRHRVFIAINLPHEIKRVLGGFEKKWSELPAKWVSPENLHITLVFLGDLTDEELGEASLAVKEVSKRHTSFEINLTGTHYGPDNKIPPRFVWASGGKSKELSLLKRNLEEALLEKIPFKREERSFNPHITLARVSIFAWRQIEPEERPEINQPLGLMFTVESIDIMESELSRTGPRYTIIESFELKQ